MNLTRIVAVDLPGRSYAIHIGPGLLDSVPGLLAPLLGRPRVAIVTEDRVAARHLPRLQAALAAAGIAEVTLILPPGEGTKGWPGLIRCTEWLLDQRVERGDLVLAFGGGVIGDLAGFASAIARRGVRLVQIPTTLLAQVDSSVGGKTGINAAQGKNLVGAFHQPVLVVADTSLLATLPRRDLLAGYGEVVKYGLLGDAAFFHWLEQGGAAAALAGAPAALVQAVAHCCAMKAGIVQRDETEQAERMLLNLGHTFGHALEAATGYCDRLLHGEGVAIGCGLAFDLSARLGLCSQETTSRVRAHLRAMGLRVDLADIPGDLPDAAALLALMGQDKKVAAGRLRFILARDIGQAFVSADVPTDAVLALLQDALALR